MNVLSDLNHLLNIRHDDNCDVKETGGDHRQNEHNPRHSGNCDLVLKENPFNATHFLVQYLRKMNGVIMHITVSIVTIRVSHVDRVPLMFETIIMYGRVFQKRGSSQETGWMLDACMT